MTTPVEAKPSVQGLAEHLRGTAEKLRQAFADSAANQYCAWASAVESLEASRIAPEGQAQWHAEADRLKKCVDYAPTGADSVFFREQLAIHLRKRIAAPQAAPAHPAPSPAAKAGVNCQSAWPFEQTNACRAALAEERAKFPAIGSLLPIIFSNGMERTAKVLGYSMGTDSDVLVCYPAYPHLGSEWLPMRTLKENGHV